MPSRGHRRSWCSITTACPPRAPVRATRSSSACSTAVLHGSIDGQDDVVAGHRCARHVLATGDGAAARGHFDRATRRGSPRRTWSYCMLETGGADAVDVGPPDDAAARGAAGEHPTVLPIDRHAGESQRRQLRRLAPRRPGGRRTRSRGPGRPSLPRARVGGGRRGRASERTARRSRPGPRPGGG